MARNFITRTVTGVKVNLKVVDVATEQVVEDSVILNKSKAIETPEGLKKAVGKALPDGKVLVSIGTTEEINKCYGIEVSKFMELAVELDPVTRSKVNTETADAE
jgi:hypothetical protein